MGRSNQPGVSASASEPGMLSAAAEAAMPCRNSRRSSCAESMKGMVSKISPRDTEKTKPKTLSTDFTDDADSCDPERDGVPYEESRQTVSGGVAARPSVQSV